MSLVIIRAFTFIYIKKIKMSSVYLTECGDINEYSDSNNDIINYFEYETYMIEWILSLSLDIVNENEKFIKIEYSLKYPKEIDEIDDILNSLRTIHDELTVIKRKIEYLEKL